MAPPLVYVCDDEMLIRLWLVEHLAEHGYASEAYETGTELIEATERRPPDLVLLDLRLPDGSGIDFLVRLKELDPQLPVIMISAHGEIETAVTAVRSGAHHFLEKPVDLVELFLLVEQAMEAKRLVVELDRHREQNRWQFADVSLVGVSTAMREVADLITRLGGRRSAATVLIRGDSGTGKDVVARAIHAQSPRCGQPFIAVNCTVLPEKLVESELFGHEAGAFTDARKAKKGLFELAHGGTVFLDEIGDMPRAAQSKLLDFLENRRFRRVGGVRDHEVDVQVVAATNRDLEAAVAAGDFREDLFYRLNVIPITLPPLRERREDVGPLALHFVQSICDEMSIPHRSISLEALRALEEHDWPGNARELRNLLERVLFLQDDVEIRLDHIPREIARRSASGQRSVILPRGGLALQDVERELISQALERSSGNKSEAARLLGISRDTLRYRMDKHGVDDGSS